MKERKIIIRYTIYNSNKIKANKNNLSIIYIGIGKSARNEKRN